MDESKDTGVKKPTDDQAGELGAEDSVRQRSHVTPSQESKSDDRNTDNEMPPGQTASATDGENPKKAPAPSTSITPEEDSETVRKEVIPEDAAGDVPKPAESADEIDVPKEELVRVDADGGNVEDAVGQVQEKNENVSDDALQEVASAVDADDKTGDPKSEDSEDTAEANRLDRTGTADADEEIAPLPPHPRKKTGSGRFLFAILGILVGFCAGVASWYFINAYLFSIPVYEELPPELSITTIAQGEFQDAGYFHRGSGTVTLYEAVTGASVLRLSDFSVTNGPGLELLMVDADVISESDDVIASEWILLSALKGTQGDQIYAVPADSAEFPFVVIWSRPFGLIFAIAELTPADG